ncbi:helix-turn-helix domain-containing protein [Microbispora sp. H10836]|uniref:TetR/AcrR family transcriptional regulator n=1 Tax=Microbispora sp. H10836 TaxID=2729106 RepID=UPI0028934B90|nr:helix-turn-helix domain-containing protein [Microbispora sp. H10836]
MPPAFSAEERARITGLLLDNGRRLFATQGLRKTSLEDLVAGTAIAKSTFYVFFDSKEALYLELMLAQMAEVKRKVIDQALLGGPDIRAGLRRFLHATLAELESNPLYGRLMTHPEEMDAVVRKLDPARVTQAQENPVTALAAFLAQHDEAGARLPTERGHIRRSPRGPTATRRRSADVIGSVPPDDGAGTPVAPTTATSR